MRIALTIQWFDPQRGGAERSTFQLAERLLAGGHELHVVSQGFCAAAARLPIVAHSLGRIRSRLGFAAAAEKKLRTLALDVVHDMGGGWFGDVFQSHDGSRLAQWKQKILLLPAWARPVKRGMIRVLPRYHAFRKLMARQFGDPQRIIVALSKMCAEDYQRYHHVPAERIRLVYNGVDTERFSPAQRPRHRVPMRHALHVADDELLLLFVGRDFHRKGLATAVRAVGRLLAQRHPVRLMVLGGGSGGNYLHLAHRCGAAGAVTLAGPISDPAPYYAAADALVLPTFYDPCSLSVLEAAASGLPTVTSRFNGVGELLSEGVDGYVLANPADDEELADRLHTLLEPERRRRMGEAARRLALQHTLDHNCEEVVAIYRRVAARRRCPAQ